MPENDIYDNEAKYKRFVDILDTYLVEPLKSSKSHRKYWIKNKANLKYFKQLFKKFDSRDTSYIRRIRLLRTFLIVNHILDKDLEKATRDDVEEVLGFAHKVNKSPKSKRDFALDVKFIWRQLFPEKDEKGRVDETICPYAVRLLNGKVDKSKEKMRGDKFDLNDFEKLVQGFSDDVRIQALLTVAFESLSRPQELLMRKIKDVEVYDNYAKIYISSFGKEGVGFLKVIDSYFYLSKWLNQHPFKHDKEAYLFINTGRVNRYEQLKPSAVNKLIRQRCKALKLSTKITLYSLKRNSITLMRLRGDSDKQIQSTARWSSTKQLKTYDLASQEEAFKVELIKKGILKADKDHKDLEPMTKTCFFCGCVNGIAQSICDNCKRPLDREKVVKEEEELKNRLDRIETFEKNITPQITKQVLDTIINLMPKAQRDRYIEKIKEIERS